jgi:hypothetical protein
MSSASKQVYIPNISIKGSFVEEVGGAQDRIVYPGEEFELNLSANDFSDPEEYHTTWISITRAVKTKLSKNAALKSS